MSKGGDQTRDVYEALARSSLDRSERAGRKAGSVHEEHRAFLDIYEKLKPVQGMSVLSVGSGCGVLTSEWLRVACKESLSLTLIDFPAVIDCINREFNDQITDARDRVSLIPGEFRQVVADATLSRYDRIEAYSVLHLVNDPSGFIDDAFSLLAPQGRLLIGDIANIDKRARLLETPEGRAFESAYRGEAIDSIPEMGSHADYRKYLEQRWPTAALIDDDFVYQVLRTYRLQGSETYLLEQPPDLAFSRTREDLLLVKGTHEVE